MCVHNPHGMALLRLAFFYPAAAGCYTGWVSWWELSLQTEVQTAVREEKDQLFAVVRVNNHMYRCAQQCVCFSLVIRRVGQAAPVTISPSNPDQLLCV